MMNEEELEFKAKQEVELERRLKQPMNIMDLMREGETHNKGANNDHSQEQALLNR